MDKDRPLTSFPPVPVVITRAGKAYRNGAAQKVDHVAEVDKLCSVLRSLKMLWIEGDLGGDLLPRPLFQTADNSAFAELLEVITSKVSTGVTTDSIAVSSIGPNSASQTIEDCSPTSAAPLQVKGCDL